TNGKRGSAVVLLFEVSAYTGFCDLSLDASIASLTDAASDQENFVMLKNPDGACIRGYNYFRRKSPPGIRHQSGNQGTGYVEVRCSRPLKNHLLTSIY
ncbi:MAG: hypothetical protein L6Q59_14730, partial [Ignavibacteriaceae bacterium]|nr:hypothetical protein [Ignavibacteriaceae bacterium]